jgi:RNA polymerase sigma factor (sigma-70 family)
MADVSVTRQIADRIRLLRQQRGWSAQRLADACAQTGGTSLTRVKIAKIESGIRKSIAADEVANLAQALGTTPAGLIEGDAGSLEHTSGAETDVVVGSRMLPVRAVRVRAANPRSLGVHTAIRAPGEASAQPAYVVRDIDLDPAGIRASLTRAARGGAFLVLVGGSSVGKTRSAFEAIKEVAPDWWLYHPVDVTEIDRFAAAPVPRTVIWLDELQNYLGPERGLSAPLTRKLLQGSPPIIIIGTIWPDFFVKYTAVPSPGTEDHYKEERKLLDLADVFQIPDQISANELLRAREESANDPRLRLALESSDYGLTQVIAAAPQLVFRYKNADAYSWAVITAAVDAARLGARDPLTPAFLRSAAPGYCDDRARATAPQNWFETAVAYATQTLHGAVAALEPVAKGGGMGNIAGYVVADYLIQHIGGLRWTSVVPSSAWDSYCQAIANADDLLRLGDSAQARLLHGYAEALYRRSIEGGSRMAAIRLANLLTDQNRSEEALSVIQEYVAGGDVAATDQLLNILIERRSVKDAVAVLSARADISGNTVLDRETGLLADLLAEQGRVGEAIGVLRARADTGDTEAVGRLATFLAERGRVHEAVEVLRARADALDTRSAQQLANLLADTGRIEELRTRANSGDAAAASRLADLLADQGKADEAIGWSRSAINGGLPGARTQLSRLLIAQGRTEEADGLLRFGLNPDGSIAESSPPRRIEPPSGFERFYRDNYGSLIRTLLTAGASQPEAEDAVAKTMVDVLQNWPEIERPLAYARKAAMSNFFKERSVDTQRVAKRLTASEIPRNVDSDAGLVRLEDREWIAQLFESLPRGQREVMAFVMDGLTSAEIASIIGKSPATVRSSIKFARGRLKVLLASDARFSQLSRQK